MKFCFIALVVMLFIFPASVFSQQGAVRNESIDTAEVTELRLALDRWYADLPQADSREQRRVVINAIQALQTEIRELDGAAIKDLQIPEQLAFNAARQPSVISNRRLALEAFRQSMTTTRSRQQPEITFQVRPNSTAEKTINTSALPEVGRFENNGGDPDGMSPRRAELGSVGGASN